MNDEMNNTTLPEGVENDIDSVKPLASEAVAAVANETAEAASEVAASVTETAAEVATTETTAAETAAAETTAAETTAAETTAPVVSEVEEGAEAEVAKTIVAPTPTVPAPLKSKAKKTTIGGQALIEGIMMCGPRRTAIAVRKADGSIYVEEIKKSASETFFEKVPLVRGCIRFFRQLITGTAALMKSAEISEEGAPEENVSRVAVEEEKVQTIAEVKEEKKAAAKPKSSKLDQFADNHQDGLMVFAAVLGLAFSVVLFILLPRLVVDTALHFFSAERSDSIKLNVVLNLIEGVVRIAIFLLYLVFTSKIKDIARVWMYHGAEHKTIACYESGEPLTVENVRKCSRFHPRCGTAFLFIVVLVSILVFCVASVFIGVRVWWVNMLVRLALVPLVGGISYEILRFCGRHDQNPICKVFIAPGLGLQKLTTKEPTDSMIEVAIASVQAVIPENSNEDIW